MRIFIDCGYKPMPNTDLRCGNCDKLLGRVDGNVEIVCPRCGALNEYNAETRMIKVIPKEIRHRTTSSGMTFE